MLKRIGKRAYFPDFTLRFPVQCTEGITSKSLMLWLQGNIAILSLLTVYCVAHSSIYESASTDIVLSIQWALQVTLFWSFALPFMFWLSGSLRQIYQDWGLVLVLAGATCFISLLGLLFQAIIWQLTTLQTLALAFQFIPAAFALCGITILLAMKKADTESRASNSNPTQLISAPDKLLVLKGTEEIMLEIKKLDFVASAGNYIQLRAGEELYLQRQTLKAFLKQVSHHGFIRIHRRFVVNIGAINSVKGLRSQTPVIVTKSRQQLPVGRVYRQELYDLIDSCSLNAA